MRSTGLLAVLASILTLSLAAYGQDIDNILSNTDQPIEITADSLEIDRDENTAIFQGSVEVVQGSVELRSNVLRVFYQGGSDQDPVYAIASNITRIEAVGDVSLISEDTEATGDWGIYEMADETIVLGGTVRLTNNGNVLVGEQLELDLTTGLSRLQAGTVDGASGRVRGIFRPPDDDEADPAPE